MTVLPHTRTSVILVTSSWTMCLRDTFGIELYIRYLSSFEFGNALYNLDERALSTVLLWYIPGDVRVSLDEGVELARHDHHPTPIPLHGHGNQDEAEGGQRGRERAGYLREQPARRDYPARARIFKYHFDLGKLHCGNKDYKFQLSLWKTVTSGLILHCTLHFCSQITFTTSRCILN